jgi:GT2 family glycosyltransferase
MVSIVIVNWNSGQLLKLCVSSLKKHAGSCRVVVVDNASEDNSLSNAVDVLPDMTVIRNTSNKGFAAACNQGWRSTDGDPILFLNPDTESFAGSITELERTLEDDNTVWAAGGCLVSPDGIPQSEFNVRPFPAIWRVAAEMFFIDELGRRSRMKKARNRMQLDEAVDIDQPAAACLMVRKTALESIGGFDESFYPAWFEDVDLCLRLRRHGGRIQYQPRARFAHLGGYSLKQLQSEEFLVHFHRNQIRYFRKHRGLLAALHVQKLITLGLLLRTAVSWLHPLLPDSNRSESAGAFWRSLRRIAASKEVLQ